MGHTLMLVCSLLIVAVLESSCGGKEYPYTSQCSNFSAGETDLSSDNTAWSAVYGNGERLLMPAGETKYDVYLITDSVQNVTARMDDLFHLGVR